jgi:hypothetical protein
VSLIKFKPEGPEMIPAIIYMINVGILKIRAIVRAKQMVTKAIRKKPIISVIIKL